MNVKIPTRIRTGKPIRAYVYSSYSTLEKPALASWQSFKTLEEGLAKFESIKPRYSNKQILFIDYGVSPSRIIYLLNQT